MAIHTIPFRDVLNFWIKLGFISFGGAYAVLNHIIFRNLEEVD
jgi:chromate transport protein ChrA